MKAKKLGLWLLDTVVFVAIAIYRITTGYTDEHYYFSTDSWFPSYSDIHYVGSSTVSVYDEPFFIICMIVMALYLLVALVLKIKGTDGAGTFALKFFAYIAAIVSVSYMYSGEGDFFIVLVVGFVSMLMETAVSESQKKEKK